MYSTQGSESPNKPQLKQPQSSVFLSERLKGLDGRLDYLSNLFELLQLATVETCNPALDLLTFAQTAYYFAVIMKKIPPRSKEESWRKFPTISHYQAGISEGNRLDANKASKDSNRCDGTYPNQAQATGISNEGMMEMSYNLQNPFAQGAVTTQQISHNLWSDHNNTHSTWEVDSIDSLDGNQFWPPELEMEGIRDDSVVPEAEAIGLVYLVDLASSVRSKNKNDEQTVMSTVMSYDALHAQELNIGIILDPSHRGKGYAHQVTEMVLKMAFKTPKCHRVQAILPDHVAKDRAICFFTQMRFDHEGTRRRAFLSPMEHEYKDVTYMGMLDTDWMLRQTDRKRSQRSGHPAPKSAWDELLSRHQREREELLNWEAGIGYSRTLRPRAQTPTQSCYRTAGANDADDELGDKKGSDASNKRRPEEGKIEWETLSSGHESDSFAIASDYDSVSERSASPGGYFSTASSSRSARNAVEPSGSDFESSSASSSSLDSGDEEAFEFVRGTSQLA